MLLCNSRFYICLFSSCTKMFSYEATFVPVGGPRGCGATTSTPESGALAPVRQGYSPGDAVFTPHLRLIGKKRRPRGQFVSTVVRWPNEESREGDHPRGYPAILLGSFLVAVSSLIRAGSTRDRGAHARAYPLASSVRGEKTKRTRG